MNRHTPILKAVKQAEERCWLRKTKVISVSKAHQLYRSPCKRFICHDQPIINQAACSKAPLLGTGALRRRSRIQFKKHLPEPPSGFSNPTWANHQSVFHLLVLEVGSSPITTPC